MADASENILEMAFIGGLKVCGDWLFYHCSYTETMDVDQDSDLFFKHQSTMCGYILAPFTYIVLISTH